MGRGEWGYQIGVAGLGGQDSSGKRSEAVGRAFRGGGGV